jgi:hypothetical protein
MERKYSVLLCFLALLFLCGTALAGNTPWPKWDPGGSYAGHSFINNPNAQGPNGQGDSYITQYQTLDFKGGAANTLVVGININAHDWGPSGLTFKAMEMRYENNTSPSPNWGRFGMPDWTVAGLLAKTTPVPYISNWAAIDQYPFDNVVNYPAGLNTMAVVQQPLNGNFSGIGTTSIPVDNGIGGTGIVGSGRCFTYNANTNTLSGPRVRSYWMMLYGNTVAPPVYPRIRIENRKFNTASDEHSMVIGKGIRMLFSIVNNKGALYTPCALEMWLREGNIWHNRWSYQVDFLSSISAGKLSSPKGIPIPPAGYGVPNPIPVKLTQLFGQLGDYYFKTYTLATRTSGIGSALGSVDETDTDMFQMCPFGCQDCSDFGFAWWFGGHTVWGRGWSRLLNKNHLPSGAFTAIRVDHAISDFNGNGFPIYRADVRTEATTGFGQCDYSPAGLLGTFDKNILVWNFKQAQAFDPFGNPGIPFTGPPAGNIYIKWIQNPASGGEEGMGANGTGQKNYVPLGDCFYNWGGSTTRPFGVGYDYHGFGDEYLLRLICQEPLSGYDIPKAKKHIKKPVPKLRAIY